MQIVHLLSLREPYDGDIKPNKIKAIITYKQQFLHSDWLRACQLIPNQCKKMKLSAKSWNRVQKSEIECKTVKLKWLTAPTLSSDKQNGGQKLNEDWNSLSKLPHNKVKCKAQQQLLK